LGAPIPSRRDLRPVRASKGSIVNEAYRFQRARALSEMGLPEHLCEVCQQRMDAVLWAVGRHPRCGSPPPISDAALARLVVHLTQSLGAVVEIAPNKKEISA
jgi:hypothetical protein